ncbi:metalloregulator ArsR/SmtB family transcription factor [Comamonadaceae bacterium G21597-S1]|nr:metalloregulator ArsR/SmtB family transcription factor [Comamonadaceae bacterium G21597-S1]
MSPPATDSLSATFAALADPTRRAILARLAQGASPVGELVKPFRISAPAISRHLRVLENAGLIERKVDAQWRICRLHAPGLQRADDWLSQYRAFWDDSLDRLVEVLEGPVATDPPPAAEPHTAGVPPPASPSHGRPPAETRERERRPTHRHPRKKP